MNLKGTGIACQCKKKPKESSQPSFLTWVSPPPCQPFLEQLTLGGPGGHGGVSGQGAGGKPLGGGEAGSVDGPSRKETYLTAPLKVVIGISSSLGLSSDFSQLLSRGVGPRVRGAGS